MSNLVERLLAEIAKKRKRIVVIGDTMTDRWVYGHTADCQDHCSKFVQERVVETPGGAANAERCLSNWGVNKSLYGFAQNECPIKTRYVWGGKIGFRVDNDNVTGLGSNYEWARNLSVEMIESAGAVLLSDYDKGFLTPKFIAEIVRICKDRSIPCVADAKRAPEVYAGCILKCNEDYSRNHDEWWQKHNSNYVQTLGETPPVFRYGTYEQTDYVGGNLPAVECVNHVGAGDCFAAHLTLALAYGFSLKEAAGLAHSAGRVYVQHPHNRPPQPSEIAADLATVTPAQP